MWGSDDADGSEAVISQVAILEDHARALFLDFNDLTEHYVRRRLACCLVTVFRS